MKLIDAEAVVQVKADVFFISICQFLPEIALIQGVLQLHVNTAAIMDNAM